MSAEALPPVQPLLPRRASGDRPLFAIMAAMAFLAGLALLSAIWAAQAGRIWTSGLDGRLTVQVMDGEQVPDALRVLRAEDGVRAEPLTPAEVDALLAPWLGNADLPPDIPVPALIRIQGDVTALALADVLSAEGIEAEVDDHNRWASRVRRSALLARLAALAVLSLIFAAGAAVSAFATQAALRAESTTISVLGQVGAQDEFVAKLFTRRFLQLGLRAAAVGTLAAFAFGVLLGAVFGPPFGAGLAALAWLAVLTFAFAGISAYSAGRMVGTQMRADRASR